MGIQEIKVGMKRCVICRQVVKQIESGLMGIVASVITANNMIMKSLVEH